MNDLIQKLDALRRTNISDYGIATASLKAAIIAELDAITLYEYIQKLGMETDDSVLVELMKHVNEDEKEHVGEFMSALRDIDEEFEEKYGKGKEEYFEIKREIEQRIRSEYYARV